MKTRLLSLILIFTMLLSFASFAAETEPAVTLNASKAIYIVHTNDVHSRVYEDTTSIGYAKLSAYVAQLQKEYGTEPILVDAGDTLHGQTLATLTRGESIIKIMNKVGYDVMTPGNHDFNYGSTRLLELAAIADFKIISANIVKSDGTSFLEPYTIIERDGVKIAFFGLSTPETTYKTNPLNVSGLTFKDPIKEAQTMVDLLEDQADVLVCIAHLGLDGSSEITSELIAQKVDGIDLIIDGHSHTQLTEPLKINNTLIVQTGDYLKNIGTVRIDLNGEKQVTGITGTLFTREESSELTPDDAVASAIDEFRAAQEPILAEIIATSEVDFDGERAHVRTRPTNLACLITSAMIHTTGADAAITNGGGIRASISKGNITRGDIITVLPFGNYIVTKRMKGSDILAALEHGLSAYPDQNGGFPQVGNIEYLFDPSKPAGQRVSYVRIKGEKLDLNKEYIVATNDFMAARRWVCLFPSSLVNEFQALDEALIAFIQANPDKLKYKVYTIQRGDALWKIARKFGHNWEELAEINNLENPDLIYTGKTLLIPAW
jgi:5'-nucleotidase